MWVSRHKWAALVDRVNEHERAMEAFRRAGILEIEQHGLFYAMYRVPKRWRDLLLILQDLIDLSGYEVVIPPGRSRLHKKAETDDTGI